jgi:hypothetical protein
MNTHPDFEELFRLLEEHRVDYMIIGGYAVAFHGYPRFTKDIDIFFDAAPENVARLRRALVDFAFAEIDLPQDAFSRMGNILSFGVAPSRVDLLNQIDGVEFAAAKPNCVRGKYGKVEVTFIGRDDLIRNKRATSLAQDSVDAQNLQSGKDELSD